MRMPKFSTIVIFTISSVTGLYFMVDGIKGSGSDGFIMGGFTFIFYFIVLKLWYNKFYRD